MHMPHVLWAPDMVWLHHWFSMKMFFKTANACEHILEFIVYWMCYYNTCFHAYILFWLYNKVSCLVFIFTTDHWIAIKFLFVQYLLSVLWRLVFYMCCLGSILLYFTLNIPSISMSCIPNNAGLSPCTVKNLNNLLIFLCFICMLHTPCCMWITWIYYLCVLLIASLSPWEIIF